MNSVARRLLVTAFTTMFALIFAGCSGADATGAEPGADGSRIIDVEAPEAIIESTPAPAPEEEEVAEAEAAEDIDASEPNEGVGEEPVVDAPDAVDAENAAGTTPDIENPEAALELLLPSFGITDTEAAIECVSAEATAADMTVADLFDSDAGLVALIRCERDAIAAQLRPGLDAIDTDSIEATPEQVDCGFNAMLEYFEGLELNDADGVFTGDAPPGAVQALVDNCDLTQADASFLLNEA